ncbi:MAG: hypothetical protein AB7P50_11155 [Alphaproteobacteria bacterium]
MKVPKMAIVIAMCFPTVSAAVAGEQWNFPHSVRPQAPVGFEISKPRLQNVRLDSELGSPQIVYRHCYLHDAAGPLYHWCICNDGTKYKAGPDKKCR